VRFRLIGQAAILAVLLPAAASAQDFGVLESAETINRGNFKVKANPMLILGENGADNTFGISLLAGYGFTDNFDAEVAAAFYEHEVSFIGGNVELWLVRNRGIDFSASGGLHFGNNPFVDTLGIDLTFLGSRHVTPRLEIFFGALDLAFDSTRGDVIDETFKTVHLVPGIEYRVAEDLDFVAEFGIGLNDNSANYISGGLAYYLR
jgi:hypothetical protein